MIERLSLNLLKMDVSHISFARPDIPINHISINWSMMSLNDRRSSIFDSPTIRNEIFDELKEKFGKLGSPIVDDSNQ
jgi:hypothetical protein